MPRGLEQGHVRVTSTFPLHPLCCYGAPQEWAGRPAPLLRVGLGGAPHFSQERFPTAADHALTRRWPTSPAGEAVPSHGEVVDCSTRLLHVSLHCGWRTM